MLFWNVVLDGNNYNSRGLTSFWKRLSVFEHIKNNNIEVALIQESHSSLNIDKLWIDNFNYRGTIIYNNSQDRGGGQIIVLK